VDQNSYRAYMLAAVAAVRLPQGTLRDRALSLRDEAARSLTPAAIKGEEAIVRSLIKMASEMY
jgi:hypothetical protein